MEEQSRAPAAAATLTSSTTSVIVWAVGHYVFGGAIPPELYGWLQLVVPAGLGWLGACLADRRRRSAPAPAVPEAPEHAETPHP